MFGMLRRMLGDDRQADGAVMEGFWCETTIKLPQKLKTPLGGNVTVVRVCVDVRYTVDGERITLQRVQLSGSSSVGDSPVNMSADRTGEAWYAHSMEPNSLLDEVVEHDLANPKSRLRKLMLRRWEELHPPRDDENSFTPGREIQFTYTKAPGFADRRCVTIESVSAESIRAVDHKDDKLKSFRIDRISDVKAI